MFARNAGCDRLATGHYARVAAHRGRVLLHRGADNAKDQSYMLARLDPKQLERIWFPLGEQDKDATRAEATSAGLAVAHYAHLANSLAVAGLALLLSVASQAGDLFESAFKRRFGVKDASHVIPGHGGIMDRLDSLLIVAPVVWLLLFLFIPVR